MNVSLLAIQKIAFPDGQFAPVLVALDTNGVPQVLPLNERVYQIGKNPDQDFFTLEEMPEFSKFPYAGGFNLELNYSSEESNDIFFGKFRTVFERSWGFLSLEKIGVGLADIADISKPEPQEDLEVELVYVFNLEESPIELGMFAALPEFLVVMTQNPSTGVGPKLRLTTRA